MPTLSQATTETRTILKWLGIIFGVIFAIFLILSIKNAIFPSPPPAPTVSFGKLPDLDLPANSPKKFTYTLNTISGSLPTFPSQEKVFKMQIFGPDLLALPRAQDKVRGVGFEDKPTKISENVYQWKDTQTGRILTMDILNLNFSMFSNFLSDPNTSFFNQEVDSAIKTAKDFLQGMKVFPDDVDEGKTKVSLYSIKNFSIIPATSLSNSQAVRVNFYQKKINNLFVFYPVPNNTPLNLLVGIIKGQPQVVDANFFHQAPTSAFSTYPLKSAGLAFEDLKNGKAYIASGANGSEKVIIRNISLGYFISEKKQDFLLPIVVFEGEGFQAYVLAVTDEWVNK